LVSLLLLWGADSNYEIVERKALVTFVKIQNYNNRRVKQANKQHYTIKGFSLEFS